MAAAETTSEGRMAERRRSARFPCDFGITMHWGAALLEGRVVDISVDGMFVEMEKPLWLGASFTAQLGLDEAVRIECVVRRIEPFRGMALTYAVPSQTERVAVTATLAKLGAA
jgi:hypothetical protein